MSGSLAKITPADYDLVRSLATTQEVAERFDVSLSTAHKHRNRAAAEQPPAEPRAQEPASAAPEDAEPQRQQAQAQPPPSPFVNDGGVPIFPDTPEGNAERFAYYEARKLNHLPNSLYDYYDVIHGRETPDERRARERSTTGRR